MTQERARFVVLGLGNELFTDEGLGVQAAHRVAQEGIPGVEVLDGGTLGLALLPELEGRRGLLVLDAVVSDGETPGTILDLGAGEVHQPRKLLMSAHQVGVSDTLSAASLMGTAPELIAAVGMVPFSLETGYGLSPEAEALMPEMVRRAVAVLSSWGVEVPVDA